MSERVQQQQQAHIGSATIVQTAPLTTATQTSDAPVYHLQLQPRARVTFDESVVDNEHLGRKKSNKCCVFHKKREFGESSSESGEDSSDDDSDSRSRRTQRRKHSRKCQHNGHAHKHKHNNDDDDGDAK